MKNTLTAIAILIASFAFAGQASAATTASLTSVANVTAGQTFNVTVSVNPNGTANFASKIEVTYPAAMVEVVSFTQNNAWTALNQPGYDVLDAAKGSLTKTAGYANGFTSSTVFGTITFKAKSAGTAVIKIGSGSMAFEESSQNAITGSSASVAIAAAKPVVTTVKTTTTTTVAPATTTATTTSTAGTDAAAAAGASAFNTTLAVLLGIALIVIIGLITMIIRKGKNSVK